MEEYTQCVLLGECKLDYPGIGVRKDGRRIHLSVASWPVRDAQGRVVATSILARDVSAYREAEEARALLTSVVECSGDAIHAIGLDGAILSWNAGAAQLTGYTTEEAIGENIAILVPSEQLDRLTGVLQTLRAGNRIDPFDCLIVRKDGSEAEASVSLSPIRSAAGQVVGGSAIVRDISERRRMEREVFEAEERYRHSFEQAPIGIVHASFDRVILRCNQRFAELLGYEIREVPGKKIEEVTCREDLTETRRALEELRKEAVRTAVLEKRFVRKDGSTTYARLTVSIQRDGEGLPLHFMAFAEDVNPRKAAEERLARMQADLQRSEERYRTAFQISVDAININRLEDGVYVDCNNAFLDIVGYTRDEVMGQSSEHLPIWAHSEDRQRMLVELEQKGFCRNFEAEFRSKSGNSVWGLFSAAPIEIDGIRCVLSVTRDISEAKAAQQLLAEAAQALRLSEERYRKVFQLTLDSITIRRLDTKEYIDVNDEFCDVLGYDRSEVIGRNSAELGIWARPEDFEQMIAKLEETGECRNLEGLFKRKNGTTLWGLISASLIDIAGVRCVLTVTRDISNAKAAEDEIRNLAFFDPLTALPNRRLLLERLHQCLVNGNRSGNLRALLFIDLDQFKTLNDTLGHQTGDLLLQQSARRLQNCVRESDTLGRLGGDEFVLMLENLSSVPEEAAAQAKSVGEKILDTLGQPYMLGGRECRSSASIGISIFGDRRESMSQILQQADIAMYQAKNAGRNTLRFFAPALQAAVNARAVMEQDLRAALRTEQFVLYYQPQFARDRFVGAEALVRWKHPWRNILGPGDFIPLAEETGLILPLGQWVLEAACRQIAAWGRQPETATLSIAVNISARQFHQPDFVPLVLDALHLSGANPANLWLELTESLLVENIEEVIAKMKELKSRGLKFSLDDFGTGYSSLAYLKKLPLSQLKIDRSFVRDVVTDESSAAIAQTVISLSAAMGLPVIAEGIETEEQRQFLTRLGCQNFQGYLFGRPLPLDQFEQKWLAPEHISIAKAG